MEFLYIWHKSGQNGYAAMDVSLGRQVVNGKPAIGLFNCFGSKGQWSVVMLQNRFWKKNKIKANTYKYQEIHIQSK